MGFLNGLLPENWTIQNGPKKGADQSVENLHKEVEYGKDEREQLSINNILGKLTKRPFNNCSS
jgi:hypothetical protein